MKTKNSTGLINQKKADQIRKLYADKVPVVDIARKYEISSSYVYSILENVVFYNGGWTMPKRNSESIKRALELRSKGFVNYAGQGNLNGRIFRIANMGDIKQEEFQQLLEVFKEIL